LTHDLVRKPVPTFRDHALGPEKTAPKHSSARGRADHSGGALPDQRLPSINISVIISAIPWRSGAPALTHTPPELD
jgi:hypothetical protein